MKLEYKYDNFYQLLDKNSKSDKNKVVIFNDKLKLTNSQLQKKVDNLSAFLFSKGIGFGDKVAMVLPNSEYFIIALFAITKIGAIGVPINNFLKHEEFEYIINDCDAKLLITSKEYKKELSSIESNTKVDSILWIEEYDELLYQDLDTNISKFPSLDDTAIIIYTSGTTGHPKGAMLSFRNIFSNAISGGKRFRLTQKDRFIVYLPMFHSFTLTVMIIAPIYFNSSLVIVKSIFPFANVLKQVLLKRVTIFLGAPQIYNALNKAKIPWYFIWFNKIRLFISGSAPLSEQVLNDFNKKFKNAIMVEGYGLSECSPAVCSNLYEKRKPLSVGPALDSYEVKIVDDNFNDLAIGSVGEIVVKGDCVMQGYYNKPQETQDTINNGWLKTGDLGTIDQDGFVFIVDRKKDIIIAKGVNVYPREIEELLYKLDGIDGAAVIGISDEKTKDEKIIAFIELKKDTINPPNESKIKHYLKEHLANFKIPKHVYFVDELPKNSTNKILKRKLKEDIDIYLK